MPKAHLPIHLQPTPFHSFPWYPSEVCVVEWVYMCVARAVRYKGRSMCWNVAPRMATLCLPTSPAGTQAGAGSWPFVSKQMENTRVERVRENERREEREYRKKKSVCSHYLAYWEWHAHNTSVSDRLCLIQAHAQAICAHNMHSLTHRAVNSICKYSNSQALYHYIYIYPLYKWKF